MNKLFQSRTLILAFILAIFSLGYALAQNKVVIVPLGGETSPSGMVSAFNSETCPTGWSAFSDLHGRIVIGMNSGGDLGYVAGAPLADYASPEHHHNVAFFDQNGNDWRVYINGQSTNSELIDWGDGIGNEGSGYYPLAAPDSTPRILTTGKTTHWLPYVQLLYCEKV